MKFLVIKKTLKAIWFIRRKEIEDRLEKYIVIQEPVELCCRFLGKLSEYPVEKQLGTPK